MPHQAVDHAIPLALSSGSLYTYGLGRVFELAAQAGFDGVEVLVDQRWDTRHADYLLRLQDRYGMPVLSVHAPFRVQQVDGWPRDELARLQRSVELAERVGARTVIVHPPLIWHWLSILMPPGRRWRLPVPMWGGREFAEWLLHRLDQFQASTRVIIAVENMPAFVKGRVRLRRFLLSDLESLQRFAHLTLDTTHLATWGFDLLAVYERLRSRVSHVHLSDYGGEQGRTEHMPPGLGSLPLTELLGRLVSDDYQGVVTVELDPQPLEASNEDLVRRHLRQSCELCWNAGVGQRRPR